MNYKELIFDNPQYEFLHKNEHLDSNIILLTLGGSHAYGTNTSTSDLDVRGIALERVNELLGLDSFEQFENHETDTTVYSFRKIINLLMNCNPNCIEILATKPEHLLLITEEGKLLRDNIDLFLTQKAIHSFGGYATAQLRRLQNALARDSYPQEEKEKHILNTINNLMQHFNDTYTEFEDGSIKLWIDEEKQEIMSDINLNKYPIRDYKNINSEISNVIKEYGKLNHRNNKKDEPHLLKHVMHLVRLLNMGTEILQGKSVQTYRPERDYLIDIRNGKYTYPEIFDIIDECEKKFDYAKQHTTLPTKPDYNKINELVIGINKKVIK